MITSLACAILWISSVSVFSNFMDWPNRLLETEACFLWLYIIGINVESGKKIRMAGKFVIMCLSSDTQGECHGSFRSE